MRETAELAEVTDGAGATDCPTLSTVRDVGRTSLRPVAGGANLVATRKDDNGDGNCDCAEGRSPEAAVLLELVLPEIGPSVPSGTPEEEATTGDCRERPAWAEAVGALGGANGKRETRGMLLRDRTGVVCFAGSSIAGAGYNRLTLAGCVVASLLAGS